MELRLMSVANCRPQKTLERAAMLDAFVLQTVLSAFSTLFGSLGVFSVYLSFLNPALAVHAVLFLAAAMAILRYSSSLKK